MNTGFSRVAWRLCFGLSCAWARASAAPRHSWLGCWHVCALVCALRLYPATPGWGVRCVCVCLGSGFGCAPPLLTWVSGFVSACVRALLVPRHSWLGCAGWVCALRLGFRPRPATPGWGVGLCVLVYVLRLYPATPGWAVRHGCVCLGSGFGCTPPLLAWLLGCASLCTRSACTPPLMVGVCSVGVCALNLAAAARCHSWLGCWGACVFVCALRLYLATTGWNVRRPRVCFSSGFGCAPPFLAGVLGCVCARSACTPPLLAGVCGVGLCAWARISAPPRHSWRGCCGVCVLVCVLRLYPATPGWGVHRGCVCLGSGFGCAPPLPAGVLGCVCSCARSACAPPLLAGVCGVGRCAWAPASAAPHHSWPG